MDASSIIVIDAGGQYCHLIARKIRELGVYSEITQPDSIVPNKLREFDGIVISGGPDSVYDPSSPKVSNDVFHLGIPVLGICYGHQLMAHALGGFVKRGEKREDGTATLKINKKINSKLLENLSSEERVWMSHGDHVEKLPEGFRVLASTRDCEIAVMEHPEKKLYGIQFHPEVYHTKCGDTVFSNFLFKICGCDISWDPEENISYMLDEIRRKVGDRSVFFLVSGGVDSTVAFSLCVKALGSDRVFGLSIDTGLLRKNEADGVRNLFHELGVRNFKVENAQSEFLNALKDCYDPEEKRHIIGEKFLEVQAKVFDSLNLDSDKWILGQGTIYPDTIESGGTPRSEIIKTHHNRVLGVQKFLKEGKLIEPIAELYKDEVRSIGEKLELPKNLMWAYPFPGPGLAIRCLCSRCEYPLEQSDKASNLAGIHGLKSVILPLRSVGVQGDGRTYNKVCVLYGNADIDRLEDISTSITNSIVCVNRVAYLVVSKNNTDINSAKVKKAKLTSERLELLREADKIVRDFVEEKGILSEIWQFPVILIPLTFTGGETVVLRPVCSRDGMTAEYYKMKKELLEELSSRLIELDGVDAILYDVSNKPPATIEWE